MGRQTENYDIPENNFSNITKSWAANAKINRFISNSEVSAGGPPGSSKPRQVKDSHRVTLVLKSPDWWNRPKGSDPMVPCDTGRVDTTMMNKHTGDKEGDCFLCFRKR